MSVDCHEFLEFSKNSPGEIAISPGKYFEMHFQKIRLANFLKIPKIYEGQQTCSKVYSGRIKVLLYVYS